MVGDAFRLAVDQLKPGQITENNALPWQADFHLCRWEEGSGAQPKRLGWWPAQRPDDVLTTATGLPRPWRRGTANSFEGMLADWARLGFVKEDPRQSRHLHRARPRSHAGCWCLTPVRQWPSTLRLSAAGSLDWRRQFVAVLGAHCSRNQLRGPPSAAGRNGARTDIQPIFSELGTGRPSHLRSGKSPPGSACGATTRLHSPIISSAPTGQLGSPNQTNSVASLWARL